MGKAGGNKTIRHLSFRSLKAARFRNIIAVAAIVLTTILFTTLFTVGMGTIETFQRATMRQVGTNAHAIAKYVTDEDFEKIKTHPLVKEISYNKILADSIDNEELLKRRGELWYLDDIGLKHRFSEPSAGRRPMAANEIMADTKALQLLGVPLEIGSHIVLDLTVKGEQVRREFVLSGWFEPEDTLNVSEFVTSLEYVSEHAEELEIEPYESNVRTGSVQAYIMFESSVDLEGKLERVLTECGYETEDETAPNYMPSNVNWAYISSGMNADLETILAFIGAALITVFTGYLIINNIFQISVIRDVRFYGLLKTIGTTGRQIKRIIFYQALILSIIGIPIGLIIGFVLGKSIIPLIVSQSFFAGTAIDVSASPAIFIGSAAFALATIWISTKKPGKVAAKVSPVEATRYVISGGIGKKTSKNSTNGGKLYKMALSNVSRSNKRTALVLASLSLSLVLLNTVFTITQGFDMDKYLSKIVDTDFKFYHAALANFDYHGIDESVSEEQIDMIEGLPGFTEGGRVYHSTIEYFSAEDEKNTQDYNLDENGYPFVAVYGLDDFLLNGVQVLEGEIDLELLKTGKYILHGVHVNDHSTPYEFEANIYNIGDKLILHNHYNETQGDPSAQRQGTQEYEIMAKILISQSIYIGSWFGNTYYLPSDVYRELVTDDPIMAYNFNTDKEYEEEFEEYLENYTENIDTVMSYSSKKKAMEEFGGIQVLISVVGGVLSFIVGLIGVLNFANSMLTSIITRKREFAMLEAIGMTGAQLKKMLIYEGLYYAAGTVLLSFAMSIAASLIIVKGLAGGVWFFTYKFVIIPLLLSWPFLILVAIILPLLAYQPLVK